jgi:(1->4)-alpha-D-glucan 1-alpha-D-glucosylmutase
MLRTMIPRATYRMQLHRGFGFDAATQCAPYLARLGVSHAYLSPYLKARAGSARMATTSSITVSSIPNLGTTTRFAISRETLKLHSLGHILDFVPNHMGVGGADNPLWLDALEWGPDATARGMV